MTRIIGVPTLTQKTVGTVTAVKLITVERAKKVIITNVDAANPIYIGTTAAVTSGTGTPLPAGQVLPELDLVADGSGNIELWAISTGGNVVTGVMSGDI